MGICETCGNEYKNTFTIKMRGQIYEFDCFECAVQKLAPRCDHCRCRIIGHGVEDGEGMYCCEHCRRSAEMDLPIIQTIAP
jgi:hypothetical protein